MKIKTEKLYNIANVVYIIFDKYTVAIGKSNIKKWLEYGFKLRYWIFAFDKKLKVSIFQITILGISIQLAQSNKITI